MRVLCIDNSEIRTMLTKPTLRQQFYRAINDAYDHAQPDIPFACFALGVLALVLAGVVAIA